MPRNVIYKNTLYHIILVDDHNYPCFLRLILNEHVVELTDLTNESAHLVFNALYKIEKIMRLIVKPDKINIASLGNVTPHLHWHIIPRFYNDKHFPNPVWGNVMNQNYKPSNKLIDNQETLCSFLKVSFESKEL